MMEYEEMKFDFWDGNDKIFNLIVLHLKRNFILILKFGDLQQVYLKMQKQKAKSRIALVRTISLSPNCASEDMEYEYQDSNAQQHENQQREQINVHQFILSEFKEKYDQLKSQYETKKRDADSLLYDKKKLEIELLNHNVEYYQKQIVRLRGEVEKYQLENEENKHRFFVAENSRKDIEATSKVKQEELKQTLKQLEKEKVNVVELRYQLAEKDKNFTNILTDIEKTNQDISQKYDQTSTLLKRAENDLKIKSVELEQLKRKSEKLQAALNEKEESFLAESQKHELNDYRSRHRIDDLEEELKDKTTKQNEKMKKLEAQVKELQNKRKSEQFLLAEKNEAANYSQNLRKKEEEIAQLEQKFRQLSFKLNEKESIIHGLQEKLKNVCSIELLNESQQKFLQAMRKYQTIEKNLQNRNSYLEKELEMAKLRTNNNGNSQDPRMRADFQQMLKTQIEENSKLKMELSLKIDEIFTLKNKIEEQQIKESLLENEIDILKKRQRAEEKNSKIGFQIEVQNLKNDVDSLRRKLQVTETKLNIKIKQVKDKDSFIGSIIIGRSKQEDVPFVVAELKRVFEAEYVNKLMEANLKITDLESKLRIK